MFNIKVQAHSGESHSSLQSPEAMVKEILKSQGADSVKQLDCNSISRETLEQLGDAVMEENHPGQMHERMDAMMGGEGSDSLKEMHIAMGQEYIGCNTGYGNDSTVGSAKSGKAKVLKEFNEDMPMDGNAMRIYGGNATMPINFALMISIQVLIITLLLVLIKYFWKKGKK